jgi:Xaa-Pro aminopeptidase
VTGKSGADYKKRQADLASRLEQAGVSVMVVTSPTDVMYLSGFRGDARLLVGPAILPSAYLLADPLNFEAARESVDALDIVLVKGSWAGKTAELVGKWGLDHVWIEGSGLSPSEYEEFRRNLPSGIQSELMKDNPILKIRAVKDAREIDLIKKAASITDESMLDGLRSIREGISERDVFLRIQRRIFIEGGENTAFDPIVVSGSRSAMPHAWPSSKAMLRGELVVLDVGAMYEGYCADLTRTAVIGSPTDRQRAIYDVVKRAFEAAERTLKPDVYASAIDAAAREIIEEAGYGEYFVHGLGHGVGLSVHELPVLRAKRKDSGRDDTMLEAGMVVTVEPGIYVPGWGGVRLEDTFAITPEGAISLSNLSRELLEV